jgi:O-antigen ligase
MFSIKKYTFRQWLFVSFAFAIPFFPIIKFLVAIFGLLFSIERIVFHYYTKQLPKLERTHLYLALLFISYFIIHLVGMLNTENKYDGWMDIESKLLFLFFGFLFLFYYPFSKKEITDILLAFIMGCLILCGYLVLFATKQYMVSNKSNYFFYTNLSQFHQPSYLAMYVNWCIITLSYFLFQNWYVKLRWVFIILIIFFSSTIALLESKSGIFVMLFTLVSILPLCIYHKKVKTAIIISLFFITALGFYILFIPATNRILQITNIFTSESDKKNEGVNVRLVIWKYASTILHEHWLFGVGTGDVNQALLEKYNLKDNIEMNEAIKSNYNAHNQYFQTFVALGIIGELIKAIAIIVLSIIVAITGVAVVIVIA